MSVAPQLKRFWISNENHSLCSLGFSFASQSKHFQSEFKFKTFNCDFLLKLLRYFQKKIPFGMLETEMILANYGLITERLKS